ncbi:hypothetical protein AVEN_193632-1 [Araneus ventricosus]|uniref:Uncharacterized protein n=1 Tax=Araneus ventricosus TaxID=182803 RepID=A0A4Y2HEY2_ARAVE|nr:hypothetical protein AVEN_193632-1 [Araneus ventricosus]
MKNDYPSKGSKFAHCAPLSGKIGREKATLSPFKLSGARAAFRPALIGVGPTEREKDAFLFLFPSLAPKVRFLGMFLFAFSHCLLMGFDVASCCVYENTSDSLNIRFLLFEGKELHIWL